MTVSAKKCLGGALEDDEIGGFLEEPQCEV